MSKIQLFCSKGYLEPEWFIFVKYNFNKIKLIFTFSFKVKAVNLSNNTIYW